MINKLRNFLKDYSKIERILLSVCIIGAILSLIFVIVEAFTPNYIANHNYSLLYDSRLYIATYPGEYFALALSLLSIFVFTSVFSIFSKKIGYKKGINYGFYLGFLLGIFGLIVTLVMPYDKSNDIYDSISKLNDLKERGLITEEEFQNQREKILNTK